MSTVAPPRQVKDARASETPKSPGQKLASMVTWTLVALTGAGALA